MHDICARRHGLVSHDIEQERGALDRSLAGHKLVDAIEALDPRLRLVLAWQLGLRTPAADVTTISGLLSVPVERVDRLIEEALEELAWELLSPTAGVSNAEAAA
jgi:hypothetical protein